MKFSSIFPIGCLAMSAFAAPSSPIAATSLQKGDSTSDAYAIMSSLYTEIQTYTGAINATSASITNSSSAADKSAAAASVGTSLTSITSAVNAANAQVAALPAAAAAASTKMLKIRQDDSAAELATLVEDILLEVSGALNGIIADLGLDPLLGFLTPLVSSLSGLLASLEVVVNDLLALVQELVKDMVLK